MKLLWRQAALILMFAGSSLAAAAYAEANVTSTLKQYCFTCHGSKVTMAGLSLEKLTQPLALGEQYQHWEKVAKALETRHMPPAKMPQPNDADRQQTVQWIRARLGEYAAKHAGDPGRVTVRRLTSAEYAYAVRDLTGVDITFDASGTDAVGGEGFTNFGDVQFMHDANLERYLESAKLVANHAVIGAGPLSFFKDPGKMGFELSAIDRITAIYKANGFRAASAEGGRPFGLERYTKALFVAWQFQNRAKLDQATTTLAQFAAREGLSVRFAEHVWSALNQPNAPFPTSEVIRQWRALPAATTKNTDEARKKAEEVKQFIISWPRWLFAAGALAEGGDGDERALILNDEAVKATLTQRFRYISGFRRGKEPPPAKTKLWFRVESANPNAKDKPLVTWKNASIRYRKADRSATELQPVVALMDAATKQRLGVGTLADGDFATPVDSTTVIEIDTPKEILGIELQAEAFLPKGTDAVLRCTVADREDLTKGRPPGYALLADPESAGYKSWKSGVLLFGANFPQASHGEPTPADRDPIPAPYENAYNQPERDEYHTKVKYYRLDSFLVDKMLDDATRVKLEQAWADLYSSFDYHYEFASFVARKFKLDLGKKTIVELDLATINALPAEPRGHLLRLKKEYDAVQVREKAARAQHVEQALELAGRAWRRPLTEVEKNNLRAFYNQNRADHDKAMRLLIARILVAPAFLYRFEQAAADTAPRKLSNYELASRMSFFLWSSIPDDELRQVAAAGRLSQPAEMERQVKRMLADPKARRLSTEFFGQWLGFYKFDQHRGIDRQRFPEFTDDVKAAMYDEAVSFFEHIVRQNRPLREVFFANYTFANPALAKHYGITRKIEGTETVKIDNAQEFQRGGLLRLGAVLATTSAPLRTSPVKRGDWVLKRVLGTPTAPPPADAGSIPADDKQFAQQTIFERLEQHKRNPTCAACHTRIDPLGFPLEHYDPVGRWRQSYSDGKPIRDGGTLYDKTEVSGIDGLINYLQKNEEQVMRNMANKLIGYALGRTVLLGDRPLIERIAKEAPNAGFAQVAAAIVTSPQFSTRRGADPGPTAIARAASPRKEGAE